MRAYAIGQSQGGSGPVFWTSPQPDGQYVECPAWATPTDGTPTIPVLSPDGSTVFVRTNAGTLFADTGCASGACPTEWSGPGTGPAVVSNGQLYVTSGTSTLIAYGLPS